MKFSSVIAEYQARDYFARKECLGFCYRHNCELLEDDSRLAIVSKFSGYVYAFASASMVADSSADIPCVALLRSLFDHLVADSSRDLILDDVSVLDLLGKSAA